MHTSVEGSLDGIHNKLFKKEHIYDTEMELGDKLTKVFLENKLAKIVDEKGEGVVEVKQETEAEEPKVGKKAEVVPENKMEKFSDENKEDGKVEDEKVEEEKPEKDEEVEQEDKEKEVEKEKPKSRGKVKRTSFIKKK